VRRFFDRRRVRFDRERVDANSSERSELCGQTLDGNYRVLRRIGTGGTGVVFEGLCLKRGARVAIKTLRPSLMHQRDLATRLRRELEVSRKVLHPGVVRFVDEGTLSDGSPYLVMPLLFGESLAQLLQRHGELPIADVILIVSRVASILHSAHAAGYVHRDVKPEHILLSHSDQGALRVTLLDFGVCSSLWAPEDEKLREAGRVFGTPSYVSPEQAAGETKIDARADLFGLGVVMFESLTGCVPFSAPTITKLLLRIIRDEAPRLRELMPEVDPGLEAIVSRLLARDPGQRMPCARSLSRALLPYAGTRPSAQRQLSLRLRTTGAEATHDGVTVELEAPESRVA
jgi:serine/threonine protein kinase